MDLTPPGTADDPLISTQRLADLLEGGGAEQFVVLDCTVFLLPADGGGFRIVSGRADFDEGHIPTAGFADLTGPLVDTDSALRFALPAPERFCDAMGELGVGDESTVVLYDAAGSMWAARVWWMLRWVGFDRAFVLDGGWRAWTEEGRPVSTEPGDPAARQLTPRVRPEVVVDRDEMLASIDDGATCIVDALDPAQYRGEMLTYGRPGHLPGAVNVPARSLIDATGRFRPLDELTAVFPGDRDARTIAYCGGGIAASLDAFAMTRLGFSDVAVYTASLQEWAADPTNPLETGER